jgi:predicted lipoprotein with Yx(FWY)xxD motif
VANAVHPFGGAVRSTIADTEEEPERMRVSKGRTFRLAAAVTVGGGLIASTIVAGAAGATSHEKHAVVVGTARSAKFGKILESGGMTLYTLKASSTPCKAECLEYWPALVLPKGVTKAKAGKGVKRSKLGTKHRTHGILQVTYGGKALYRYSGDKKHGQTNGNLTDEWGKWSVVVTAKTAGAAAASSTTSSSPGSTTSSTVHGTPATPTTRPAVAPTTSPGHAPPTSPPTTRPPTTVPPTTTTRPPATTTTRPPTTTTTTSGGGGGISF